MRRSPNEIVQEFSTRSIKFYNSISSEVKPPPMTAQLRYVDSFENNFCLLLRETRSTSIDDMMSDAIEVEVNLMASGKIKADSNRDMNRAQDKV